jgi:hypothetical protein
MTMKIRRFLFKNTQFIIYNDVIKDFMSLTLLILNIFKEPGNNILNEVSFLAFELLKYYLLRKEPKIIMKALRMMTMGHTLLQCKP